MRLDPLHFEKRTADTTLEDRHLLDLIAVTQPDLVKMKIGLRWKQLCQRQSVGLDRVGQGLEQMVGSRRKDVVHQFGPDPVRCADIKNHIGAIAECLQLAEETEFGL